MYRAYSRETGIVGFIRNQDPIFAAYRYLASAPGVSAVWQVDRPYFNLPGYYYLHRTIPFYDANTGRLIFADKEEIEVEEIASSVSHILTADPATFVPGYSVKKEFGDLRILRRDADEPAIREWREYAPTIAGGQLHQGVAPTLSRRARAAAQFGHSVCRRAVNIKEQ